MSEETTGSAQPQEQPAPEPVPLAQRIAELNQGDAPVQEQPAAAPPETAPTQEAETPPAPEAQTEQSAGDDVSAQQPEAEDESNPQAAQAGDADKPEPEPDGEQADQQAPAEGYDADRGVFVKQYNLGVPALHELGADELAEHPQTAALLEAAARAAQEQGYAPTGPAEFVYGAPDGNKSALSYAVPVASRTPVPVAEQPEAPTGT